MFKKSQQPGATPISDEEEDETVSGAIPTPKKKDEKKVKVSRANTNAIVLQLGNLGTSNDSIATTPCVCGNCGVIVSTLSALESENGRTSWKW